MQLKIKSVRFSTLLCLALIVGSGDSIAGSLAQVGGGVNLPANIGGGFTGSDRCSYEDSGAPGQGDICTSTANYSDIIMASGGASSSVDSAGLHAYAIATIFDASGDVYKAGPFSVVSSANASLDDRFNFLSSAPESGLARISLTAEGTVGTGASFASQLTAGNASDGYSSCFVTHAGGSCSVNLAISFRQGIEVYQGIQIFAVATISLVDGDSSRTITNFQDTAFVSGVSFFNSSGSPLELAYSTDSGYVYPLVSSVPEPSKTILLLLGFALTAILRKLTPVAPLASRSRFRIRKDHTLS